MPQREEPPSIKEMREQRLGWPKTKGIRIGQRVELPHKDNTIGGRVIGVEEIKREGRPEVYATVKLGQHNVYPKIEVGKLQAIQEDIKLINHIETELRTISTDSKHELDLIVERIRQQIARLNKHQPSEDNPEYHPVGNLGIVIEGKSYRVLLLKSDGGTYRLDVTWVKK